MNGEDGSMAYVDIVTALAILQFLWLAIRVGSARDKYGVKAPAITGNEMFERHFRVQQNTLEQLIMFLPGLYLFSHYFNPLYAAGLGVLFLIGRTLYAFGYVKDPGKRSAGFLTGFLPTVVLMGGGLIGAVMRIFGH
jgi:glutathione S-transferase